jgi:hypothetical protein
MDPNTSTARQEDLLTLRPSWRSYFVFYAAVLIFGIGPSINPDVGISRPLGLIISILLMLFVFFSRKATLYRITQDEVLRGSGFLGQAQTKSLPITGIADLEVRRGLFHRLLGIGHLQFRSRLSDRPDLWWFGIDDPFAVKKNVERFLLQ